VHDLALFSSLFGVKIISGIQRRVTDRPFATPQLAHLELIAMSPFFLKTYDKMDFNPHDTGSFPKYLRFPKIKIKSICFRDH